MSTWMKVVATMALALSAMGAKAANYVEGKDYIRLGTPQAVSPAAKGKIEVVEFFWYGCPHCYRLQKPWEKWLETNGKWIEYRPQPAVLGKSWEIMGRAYHAMVGAGGFDRQLHHNFFTAIHEKRLGLQDLKGDEPKTLYEFVGAEKGQDYLMRFKKEYDGFSMGARIAKDRDIQKSYRLEGTPTIVVGGKYSVSSSTAGGEEAIIPIVDFLVKKVQAEVK